MSAAIMLLGAALGGLFGLVARARGRAGERRLLGVGLLLAAAIYVGFALPARDAGWLLLEAAGLAVFGALAWLGVRASLWWLVLGWVTHVGWDVELHLERSQPVVGDWYPLLCIGFDLVVAGFLLGRAAEGPARPATAAAP